MLSGNRLQLRLCAVSGRFALFLGAWGCAGPMAVAINPERLGFLTLLDLERLKTMTTDQLFFVGDVVIHCGKWKSVTGVRFDYPFSAFDSQYNLKVNAQKEYLYTLFGSQRETRERYLSPGAVLSQLDN